MVRTTGEERKDFYEPFVGKDVWIRYAQELGDPKEFIQVRIVRLDEDSLYVTGSINANIPYDIVNEIIDPDVEELPRPA